MENFRLCDKHLKVVFEISQIKSGINIECFDVIDNETVAINIQLNKKEINSLINYLLEIQKSNTGEIVRSIIC